MVERRPTVLAGTRNATPNSYRGGGLTGGGPQVVEALHHVPPRWLEEETPCDIHHVHSGGRALGCQRKIPRFEFEFSSRYFFGGGLLLAPCPQPFPTSPTAVRIIRRPDHHHPCPDMGWGVFDFDGLPLQKKTKKKVRGCAHQRSSRRHGWGLGTGPPTAWRTSPHTHRAWAHLPLRHRAISLRQHAIALKWN